MAEILVRAKDNTLVDNPVKDRIGSYKKGYPVVVVDDGHVWGDMEGLPNFVVIKVPTISIAKVNKYIMVEYEEDGETIYRRRIWKIRWDDLPLIARNLLRDNGELIIKAGSYGGQYDYTWKQVKEYFRNQNTGLDETEDL